MNWRVCGYRVFWNNELLFLAILCSKLLDSDGVLVFAGWH